MHEEFTLTLCARVDTLMHLSQIVSDYHQRFSPMTDAPVCAQGGLQRTLGVARGTPVIVTCRVEAEPARHLSWMWVKILGDGTEQPIPAQYVKSAGLTSSVELTPMTADDYGDLLCRASNVVGRQRESCVVSLVAAGPPDPPLNCSAAPSDLQDTTAITHSLVVACFEGFDGGLPQGFVLQAQQDDLVVANMTRCLFASNVCLSKAIFLIFLCS